MKPPNPMSLVAIFAGALLAASVALGQSALGNVQFPLGNIVAIQANAPVQVAGVRMQKNDDETRSIRSFIIANDSGSKLEAVQLGWTLHDCGPAEADIPGCEKKVPVLKGVSSLISIEVHAGQSKRLEAPVVNVEKLKSKLSAKGFEPSHFFLAVFGVATAQFADGTRWEYDIINEPQWEWEETAGVASYELTQGGGCNQCCRGCFEGGFCLSAICSAVCCCDVGGCWGLACGRGCGIPASGEPGLPAGPQRACWSPAMSAISESSALRPR